MSRLVLVAGLAAAGVLGDAGRKADERIAAWLSGLIGVAVVGGVDWFRRARSRRGREAGWDASATSL